MCIRDRYGISQLNKKDGDFSEKGKERRALKDLNTRINENHYSWRDSFDFDLEEMTIAQRNSRQNQNKLAAQARAQEAAKQRIGSGTAKNPDTTIAQVKQQNLNKIRTNAMARNVDFKAERRPAAKPVSYTHLTLPTTPYV